MERAERIDNIKKWLDAGQCLTRPVLQQRLGVSWATIKRDFAHLRLNHNAPLYFDRGLQGWRLDASAQPAGTHYGLDISLREDEIHALLSMQQLLAQLEPGGLLGPHVARLRGRFAALLDKGLRAPADVARRIRVLAPGARPVTLPHFQAAAHALLRRRQLAIRYHARGHDETVEREVSPQRLAHYKGNWYLDAWCHLREALRSFSLDRIVQLRALDTPAIDVPEHELDALLGGSYGIFAGRPTHKARLRFSPERARWVAGERWHPNQLGRFDAEGRWVLDLPYADPRELVMDILRHVPEVEVMWPDELVGEVRRRSVEGLRRMGSGAG